MYSSTQKILHLKPWIVKTWKLKFSFSANVFGGWLWISDSRWRSKQADRNVENADWGGPGRHGNSPAAEAKRARRRRGTGKTKNKERRVSISVFEELSFSTTHTGKYLPQKRQGCRSSRFNDKVYPLKGFLLKICCLWKIGKKRHYFRLQKWIISSFDYCFVWMIRWWSWNA